MNSLFDDVAAAARTALDRAQVEATSVTTAIDTAATGMLNEVDRLRRAAAEQAERFADEKLAMLKAFQEEKKALLVGALAKKLVSLVGEMMAIGLVKVKEAVDDPWMPRFVKRAIDAIIDALWPDVTDNVKDAIFASVHPNPPVDHGEPPSLCACCCCVPRGAIPVDTAPTPENDTGFCCCGPCARACNACTGGGGDGSTGGGCCGCCFACSHTAPFFGPLAWLKYELRPYDRSFWQQLRDPAWWCITAVSLIPVFGVSQLFFVMLFMISDWDDQFSLLQFISAFKGTQFFSLGVVSGCVGAVQYFLCASTQPSTCPRYAPRELLHTAILFAMQIVLVWVAFAMLTCAKNKGGLYHQIAAKRQAALAARAKDAQQSLLSAMTSDVVEQAYVDDVADTRDGGDPDGATRGRLRLLLLYDTLVFCIAAGAVVWGALDHQLDPRASLRNYAADDAFREDASNWKFLALIWMAKTFYGLLSFPFLALVIPGVSALFCRAKPTGVNPYGVTVPLRGFADPDAPWRFPERRSGGGGAAPSAGGSAGGGMCGSVAVASSQSPLVSPHIGDTSMVPGAAPASPLIVPSASASSGSSAGVATVGAPSPSVQVVVARPPAAFGQPTLTRDDENFL
jgi:hypothetical protein